MTSKTYRNQDLNYDYQIKQVTLINTEQKATPPEIMLSFAGVILHSLYCLDTLLFLESMQVPTLIYVNTDCINRVVKTIDKHKIKVIINGEKDNKYRLIAFQPLHIARLQELKIPYE